MYKTPVVHALDPVANIVATMCFQGPHVGRTNRELAKRKNYQMVQAKIKGRNRNRTFRDKQMSLRKYLLRQQGKKA